MTWLRMSSAPVPALAVEAHHDHRRHDRHQPRDEPPQPRPQPDVDEAFHDDLPGQRAGQRRVLAGTQQRHREEHARRRVVPSSGDSSM